MRTGKRRQQLSTRDLKAILEVTVKLAAPFDLMTMLGEVVAAAKEVLGAERGSVWLHDPATDELVLEVATGITPVRVRRGAGLVGACARDCRLINVPDCYADPRFDPAVDRASGYRTRCMLTLPLIDHKDVLVGVMQILNKSDGVFDADDELVAAALAGQCAVALQRVRMTAAVIEGERMRRELEMARDVQMSTLPARLPELPGYELAGSFRPAELTGGDTYDLALIDQGLLVVLGAFRLGADLDAAFREVNNRLAETLPADRFITAFIGLLDPQAHRLCFHSGGQGPILHYRAATRSCECHKPTSFPLGAMPMVRTRPAVTIDFEPGDVLLLLSDGYYEYADRGGEEFGEPRVRDLLAANHGETAAALLAGALQAIESFAGGAQQQDDMTAVVIRRAPRP